MRYRSCITVLSVACLALFTPAVASRAAEYKGRSIDHHKWRGTAYSFSTHRTYTVEIVFSGSEATVTFPRGQRLTLLLDDERIEDLWHIAATDDASGTKFELAVDLKR